MTELEEKYPEISINDHIRSKDMWAGSSQSSEHTDYTYGDTGIATETLSYPPALYKAYDEPMVNASDHLTKNPKLVTEIRVTLADTGVFSVWNNGPGVEIQRMADGMWVPQKIFGVLFKGSNLRPRHSIIGGTHGVGVKLSNVFSKWFRVTTVSLGQSYSQTWSGGMERVEEPKIAPSKDPFEFTEVSFLPDYHGAFKWGGDAISIESIVSVMRRVVRMRCVKLAAYCGYLSSGKCRVRYNDELIPITSFADLSALMFPSSQPITVNLSADATSDPYATKYWWEVTIVKLSESSLHADISNVNGVSVRRGSHVDWISEQIVARCREAVIKELCGRNVKFREKYITDTYMLMINAQIPGVKWEGQRKDEAIVPKSELKRWLLDAKTLTAISSHVIERCLETIYLKAESGTASKTPKVSIDKYQPAELAGGRRAGECYLLLAEGDSAATFLRAGVTAKRPGAMNPELGFNRFGILTLGGVIVNARKMTKTRDIGGVSRHVLTQQLIDNKFFKSFTEVMGLKLSYKYDPATPSYRKEWSELRYRGGVIICVDQDHAGEGFICSLILNMIALYWPNLIRCGLVKRFVTPYLRAYPKTSGKVFEFTSPYEWSAWQQQNDQSKYTIKYIKGLGTHESSDTRRMFLRFWDYVYTFTLDPGFQCPEEPLAMFTVYFGEDADRRKHVLRSAKPEPPPELLARQQSTHRISTCDQLQFKMREHMEADLIMKLWHSLDGLNESGRKITHAVRRRFARDAAEIKVAQLGGYVAENEDYHYGEQSLYDNIIGKAYTVVGGVQLPIVIPIGQFGTRNKAVAMSKSGKIKIKDDNAAPRYIYTTLNRRLSDVLYPPEDDALLNYILSDGEHVEPTYYIPIVPPVYESTEIPSEGWKIKVWAREITDVIRAVKTLIKYPNVRTLPRMRPYVWGHRGTIRYIRGDPYSMGSYWYSESEDAIVITELPLRVWTAPFVANLEAKQSQIIAKIVNHSSDVEVNIRVYLVPGAISQLERMADGVWTDGVEEYFGLRVRMDSHINMISPQGGVVSFADYERVLFHWFPYRRDLYTRRVERMSISLRLRIRHLELVEQFADARETLTPNGISRPEAIGRLEAAGYPKLTPSVIEDPGFLTTDQIEPTAVNGPKSSYGYLFSLTQEDMFEEAREQRRRRASGLRSELEELTALSSKGAFTGAHIWLMELDELERVVNEGRATQWTFGRKARFTFD